jgi:hypothetical protein
MNEEYPEPRQDRRADKRASAQAKMEKHGKGLVQMYRDAILKRFGAGKDRSR